ncbi:MAG TPA: sugar phosphate isomerase/epimerase family protein [Verrucomicrobiae bacterium]|nr:sugar phosphate isomerase/epimerase family protein [Verrucomicrobiae bacterium]
MSTISSFQDRLAVCSWSLQPATPEILIQHLRDIGIPAVQIALDPIREQPAVWGHFRDLCAQNNIAIVSGMFGTVGEDYTTMDSIRQTGGVVPDATWEQNWKNIQANAGLASRMGIKLVTFHAGFLPHEESDPAFTKLLRRIEQISDVFARHGIELGFETGQETAETLACFLRKLGRPGVGVNFDPANMILYDKGNPIESLRALAPWLKQCHIKDARRTKTTGTWGEEVVVGTGEVDWTAFFEVLREARYNGFCSIEREAGNQRVADIRAARQFIGTLAK